MLLETVVDTATTTAALPAENRIIPLIADADPIIQLTLLILVIFSVISWAIIMLKFFQLRSAKAKVARFTAQFWKAKSIESFMGKGRLAKGPASKIFLSGIAPLNNGDKKTQQQRTMRETRRAADEQIAQMEHYIPFLATTASATPFIGLFGTCWGILNAFYELSAAGSSSLQVVGPRIAEALFATALGLAVAIPAVIFYNFYFNKIRILTRDVEEFAEDVTHRIEVEYFAA